MKSVTFRVQTAPFDKITIDFCRSRRRLHDSDLPGPKNPNILPKIPKILKKIKKNNKKNMDFNRCWRKLIVHLFLVAARKRGSVVASLNLGQSAKSQCAFVYFRIVVCIMLTPQKAW